MIPTRFTNLSEARKRFGRQVDKLAPFLLRTDPPADELVAVFARLPPRKGRQMLETALAAGSAAVPRAPRELHALFAQLEDVPFWVSWDQLDLAGATHRRCGLAGGLVLACHALPLIYSSPAGNKPLVFSGRLVQRAERRLSETARFVVETCKPGGLRRGAEGWKITVKVRLIHAQLRRLLRQSDRWNQDSWGLPINQVDMAYTNLLFSAAFLASLRMVGFHFSPAESQSVMHLWRYSGHLLGIEPDLQSATEDEGNQLLDLIRATQDPPDKDAQDLTRALMETAIPGMFLAGRPGQDRIGPRLVRFCYGLSHTLLGSRLAGELGYPKTLWRYTARLLARVLIAPTEIWRRLVPGAQALAVAVGTRGISSRIATNPGAAHPTYQMPSKLGIPPDRPESSGRQPP